MYLRNSRESNLRIETILNSTMKEGMKKVSYLGPREINERLRKADIQRMLEYLEDQQKLDANEKLARKKSGVHFANKIILN